MFSGVSSPFPTLRKRRSGRSERSSVANVLFVLRFYTAWTGRCPPVYRRNRPKADNECIARVDNYQQPMTGTVIHAGAGRYYHIDGGSEAAHANASVLCLVQLELRLANERLY